MGLEGKPGWILSWSIVLSRSIMLSQSIILSCCIPLANMSVGCRCGPHPRAPARWVFFSLFPSPRAGSGFWKVSRILCIFPEILEPDVALCVVSHQLPRGGPNPKSSSKRFTPFRSCYPLPTIPSTFILLQSF